MVQMIKFIAQMAKCFTSTLHRRVPSKVKEQLYRMVTRPTIFSLLECWAVISPKKSCLDAS